MRYNPVQGVMRHVYKLCFHRFFHQRLHICPQQAQLEWYGIQKGEVFPCHLDDAVYLGQVQAILSIFL